MISNTRKASVLALESAAVMAVYFAAGKAGLAVPFTHANISPVWPAAGVALAAILLRGRHVCLGVFAGAFLVNFFSPIPHTAALFIALGNTLGPAVAAELLRRKAIVSIQKLADVLNLILFGCLGTLITALIGTATLFLLRVPYAGAFPDAVLVWWIGDLMGAFLIVPLILNFTEFKLSGRRLAEFGLLIVCLAAGSEFLFRQTLVTGSVFGFFLLPFVIWGAVRFSVAGAAFTSLLVSGFAVWDTGRGEGPFLAIGNWLHHVQTLQVFIAVLSLSGLCLAAVIAERTKAEAALAREEHLRRAQEQYRRIVETTNEGVWLFDADFKTTFANQRMAEMLGVTPEEMTGRHLFEFYFPEDIPQKQKDVERRRNGVREIFYNRLRRKDGSEIWTLVSTSPIILRDGKFSGVMAMLSDVTRLRKSEEILLRNEKLITAGRLAASISHEVNNPLEAVVNLLYLLQSEPMTEQARHYVELATREIQRVSAISRRSLGFFRDAAAWSDLSLPELLDDTLSFYEYELASRGIRVVREYSSPGVVHGSRGELQQVFTNLISNALDAMGHDGMLTVRVYDALQSKNPGIAIDVEDTGSGIRGDDIKRIFEPFFTTKQNTGTGLGLWVAQEIVQKHGGTIAVRSESGAGAKQGARFSIFLPVAAAANAVA